VQHATTTAGLGSTVKVNAGETGRDLKGLFGLGDFVQGSETPATLATDLNDLSTNRSDYEVGDSIEVSGTDVDGTPVVASFVYGTDGTTVGDLVAFLDASFGQATVAFDADSGQISLTADTTGAAELSLALSDGANQTGGTSWSEHFFSVTTNGTGPDQVTTSIEVFDRSGTSHILTFTYTRQDDGTWTMVASLPPGGGTVSSSTITGITFNTDGSLQSPSAGSVTVDLGTGSQQIRLDLGAPGTLSGLTQLGSPGNAIADQQDGYGAGELASLQVDPDGTIEGFYTNGQTRELAGFGVATFANDAGLEELGDGYFRESPNSGQRLLLAGTQNGAGEVVGGALESSNVDTAEEFVHLIEAQRGFQANARVITVQDELLAEIVNVI
jgi:flagellar hook protein FlgE